MPFYVLCITGPIPALGHLANYETRASIAGLRMRTRGPPQSIEHHCAYGANGHRYTMRMGFAHCATGIANPNWAGGVLDANPRTKFHFYVKNKKMKKKKREEKNR